MNRPTDPCHIRPWIRTSRQLNAGNDCEIKAHIIRLPCKSSLLTLSIVILHFIHDEWINCKMTIDNVTSVSRELEVYAPDK